MRFGLGMRQAALVVAVLGVALGGCGSLSGGLKSESLLAATSAPADTTDPANPVAAALAPEAQPTGAVGDEPGDFRSVLCRPVADAGKLADHLRGQEASET